VPTYVVTDSKTGTKLRLTGDSPPSEAELEQIFSEHNQESQQPQKLTEENIVTNPDWIRASKSVYQLNEGPDALGFDSDKEYANYGLRYMGWFNYNLPKMGVEAAQLTDASDEQKKEFITLMDMYDAKEADFSPFGGLGRFTKGVLSDPSTYVGIGTLGAATAGAQATKLAIKEGVKQATKAGLKQGAKVGAIEGAAYTTADNALRQSARITAGVQEDFDLGQSAKAAAIGATAGSVLGGTIGGIGSRSAAKKTQTQVGKMEAESSIIDTKTTVAQARKEIQPELKEFNEDLAQDIRKEVGGIKEDLQTDFDLDINQKGIDVGVQILDELKIPRDPNIKISDQILYAIQLINRSPEYKNAFINVLKRNKINENEFAQMWRLGTADSARRLAQLSVASRAMKNIGDEIAGTAPKEGMAGGLIKSFGDTAYKLDNIRRGLLVSQIATSMRNFTAQVGRVGMHTLTKGMDSVLNTTFNPMRRLFGADEVPIDHTDTFGLLMNLTANKKKAKETTEFVTKYFGNEKDRLFNNYASEVADASQSRTFKGAQKVVDGLNTLNRMQEFYYRRGMFASSLDQTLRKKGISLDDAIKNNDMSSIAKADIQKAVDDALEFTYAKTPDNIVGETFVKMSNYIPFITTGVVPFARFMSNAMKFQFQHSPLGPLSLLSRAERAKVASGDMGVFSKAMIGSAALMAAVEAKRKGFGGEKWYELKGPDGTTIDARPYFPLTPYLLVADAIVRAESGRGGLKAKDIIQGLTGAQFRTGTGLALIDNLIDHLSGVESEEKVNRVIADFVSNVLGGFLTPLRMFNDFIDQDQEFRTIRPTGEILPDVVEELKRSVPFVREDAPETQSPTRAATPGRPSSVRVPFTDVEVPGPLSRQLTGITVKEPKNLGEKELDRLGLRRRDILPYTGDRVADQIMAKYMGPIAEVALSTLVISPQYQRLNNPAKEIVMREVLKEIRKEATGAAQAEDPERFAKIKVNRLQKSIRRLIDRLK
jgi:hypothetical protein